MRPVPSDVYLRTRDALATLVSERAARRVLNAALRHASVSADTLDEGAVRKLLLGPVQRELEGILPRAGLRRTLRRLARQVADGAPRAPEPAPVTALSPLPSEAHSELQPVTRSSVYLPGIASPDDAPAPGAAGTKRAAPGPRAKPAPEGAWPGGGARGEPAGPAAAVVAAVGAPTSRIRAARVASEPTVVPRALAAEVLDRLMVHFAEIEGVTQVIGLRDRNDPAHVRGEGLDPDALGPLARSSIRLLGRHGPLRSLVLEHPGGLLFIFPLGRDAVAVLAGTDVNMGAVFAARAALEEAQ